MKVDHLQSCTTAQLNGFLPGFTDDGTQATNRTEMVSGLWVNSWIVLLAVGVITWALMGWAAIVYRRRRGQTGLPSSYCVSRMAWSRAVKAKKPSTRISGTTV
jgi:hypothetical protein